MSKENSKKKLLKEYVILREKTASMLQLEKKLGSIKKNPERLEKTNVKLMRSLVRKTM